MISTGLLILASGVVMMIIVSVPELRRRLRVVFPGWFMAGLGAMIMALGSAPFFYGLPIWTPVLRHTFGWTPGQMSWAYAITQIEGGFLAPVAGMLIDKVGPRRIVFSGLIFVGSGFLLFSQIRELWHLYVCFFVMSLGASLSTWIPMMTVMNNWFVRYKARAMSLVQEGTAIGGIVVPILLAWAIGGADPNISERYGWRVSAIVVGILILALAVPLSLLIRNRPEDLGLKPDGDTAVLGATCRVDPGVAILGIELEGYTLQQAIRTRAFWLISLGHGFAATIFVTTTVHVGLMLDDRGFTLQTISAVSAVYTAATAVSMLVGGYLGDRLPMRFVAFTGSALQSFAIVAFVLTNDIEMLLLFAVLFGTGAGIRISVIAALRGAYFGRRAFAGITGLSIVPINILVFIGPVFAGLMRDVTGSYDVAFLTIGTGSIFGSFLFLLLGEPPRLAAQGTRDS